MDVGVRVQFSFGAAVANTAFAHTDLDDIRAISGLWDEYAGPRVGTNALHCAVMRPTKQRVAGLQHPQL